jgi:hypothetical protein
MTDPGVSIRMILIGGEIRRWDQTFASLSARSIDDHPWKTGDGEP